MTIIAIGEYFVNIRGVALKGITSDEVPALRGWGGYIAPSGLRWFIK